ncbi:MAG: cytochrome c biogenesis protein ResB [Gemmataceae bacterium]|nr:cytochrome c biogenesis protein ResB [Gemmataceae bacterium]MDW8264377.1 cytochrome c biogenesis protein ResB [Gemmataceae bacterium]
MNDTALKPPLIASPADQPPTRPLLAAAGAWVYRTLELAASLRLTVVLFALSVGLVFLGTLAQMDEGLAVVLNNYFRSIIAWLPVRVFVRFGQVFLNVDPHLYTSGDEAVLRFPYPGGWLLGSLLMVNLLAAHLVRFRLTWKRSGVLVLHSGLFLLMLSEWIAGMYQVEGNMTIPTGGMSNYTENRDRVELVFIDTSDPKEDAVVAVPGALLREGEVIRHPDLPVDVRVERYYANSSEPRRPRPGEENPATAGDGVHLVTEPRRRGVGVDAEQRIDLPSAYVTFLDKKTGASRGTYLQSVWLSALSNQPTQPLTIDGKTWQTALRFERSYRPYTLYLLEFRHDKYIGTETPKNFSSLIRLVDPQMNEDRQVLIRMNEPLRYRGETFYQSSFLPGDRGTVLQVVRNPGWRLPYVSCGLVAGGMLVHFLIAMVGFFVRLARKGTL